MRLSMRVRRSSPTARRWRCAGRGEHERAHILLLGETSFSSLGTRVRFTDSERRADRQADRRGQTGREIERAVELMGLLQCVRESH